jgi:hypothetical protein
MGSRERASRLRQEIGQLADEWNRLQKEMLRPERMIPASLIARHLGTRERKRASTAYYLSWAEQGKTILRHVRQEEVEGVRVKVQAWGAYRRRLRRCRQIAGRLLELLDQLGHGQAERPGSGGTL